MSIATLPDTELFRTTPLRGLPDNAVVNREARTITGIRAMQMGRVNDSRPFKADRTTLEQLVGLVNQRNNGVKSRFAHPNMSNDGMGRHLGRMSNARIVEAGEDTFVSVDQTFSDASKRTPNGNLFEHVMDMAEESPEDFGVSVAPRGLDEEAMEAEKGDDGLSPIRFKGLTAIDFVDDPAATRGGLFSTSDHLADLPEQATFILDTFFGDARPDVIRGRFEAFLKTYFASKGEPMSDEKQAAELAAAQTKIAELEAKFAELTPPPVEPPVDDKQAAAKAELTRRGEITALCTLAKVSDVDRELMFSAGFTREAAQDYLKSSGRLSVENPPVGEGGGDPKPPPTPDDKFGIEFDTHAAIYERMEVTRDDYIASRKLDAVQN